jgi:hypothetical protein
MYINTFIKFILLAIVVTVFMGESVADPDINRFVDKKDGTILDTKTGLMWHKKDFSLRSVKEELKSENLTIQDLEKFVRDLRTAGYKDWRIATPKEFATIQYLKGSPEWINHFAYSVGSYLSLRKQKEGATYTTTWTYSTDSNEIGFRPVRGTFKD